MLRRVHITDEGRQVGNDPVRRQVRRPNGSRASHDRMGPHPPRVHGHHEVGLVRRPVPGHDVGRGDGPDAAHADVARPRLPTFGFRRFPAIVTGFAAIAAAREGLWCPVGTQDRAPLADGHAAGQPGPRHRVIRYPVVFIRGSRSRVLRVPDERLRVGQQAAVSMAGIAGTWMRKCWYLSAT